MESTKSKEFIFAEFTPLQTTLELLQQLKAKKLLCKNYYLQANSLTGLHFLSVLTPQNICFFHHNLDFLQYLMLVLELIQISFTPDDFISRIFSRSVSDFIEKGPYIFPFSQIRQNRKFHAFLKKNPSLNPYTQWSYLNRPKDLIIDKETLNLLSLEGKKRYQHFFAPYDLGCVFFAGKRSCRLLPCWPIAEPIPFSEKAPFAENACQELEPSTNVFFFGCSWLENVKNYSIIKKKLFEATLTFVKSPPSKMEKFDIGYFGKKGLFFN